MGQLKCILMGWACSLFLFFSRTTDTSTRFRLLASSCRRRRRRTRSEVHFISFPAKKARRLLARMAYLQYGRNGLRQIIKAANFQSSGDGAVHPLLHTCQGIRYRKLEVILTTNIEKLGKAGQTVKVAPGYFRNHLMPKLLAVPNIDKFAYMIREQRKMYPHEEEEVKVVKETVEDPMKEYEAAAKRLANTRVTIRTLVNAEKFKARATKDDPIEILSPVTKDDLVKEVARQLNVQIEPENVHLPSPLTTMGEHDVPLRLPKSIPLPEGKLSWTLKVKIRGR